MAESNLTYIEISDELKKLRREFKYTPSSKDNTLLIEKIKILTIKLKKLDSKTPRFYWNDSFYNSNLDIINL